MTKRSKPKYCECTDKVQSDRAKPDKDSNWSCTACGHPLSPDDTRTARDRFWLRYGRHEGIPA